MKRPVFLSYFLLTELTREKEWDNIVACHQRLGPVSTWSYDKARMGEHKLLHKRFKGLYDVEAVVRYIMFDMRPVIKRISCTEPLLEHLWQFCDDWIQYWTH